MAKKEEAKAYRALVGIDFVHKETGNSHRVEAGGKIEGMNEVAIKNELAAKNIEEWVPRQTENVGVVEDGIEVEVVTADDGEGEG